MTTWLLEVGSGKVGVLSTTVALSVDIAAAAVPPMAVVKGSGCRMFGPGAAGQRLCVGSKNTAIPTRASGDTPADNGQLGD